MMITEKQRNLLMMSESIKEEGFYDLYKYLKRNKTVSISEARRSPLLKNIHAYIDELITESQLEWEEDPTQPVKDLGEKFKYISRKCDLCGKKPIRYEHRIRNTSNAERIVIGSECSKEFGDELQAHLREGLRNSKKASRRLFLENKIEGLRSYIENGWKFTRELEMIIPMYLEEKWQNLHTEMAHLYESFITEKRTDYLIFKKKWQQKDALKQEITSYISKNKNKEHASDIKIHTWLLQNEKHDVIKMIQEDNGFLKWKTIHRIYEIDLMVRTLKSLNKSIDEYNIQITGFEESTNRVYIRFVGKKDRKLECTVSYSDFILEFGGLLFNDHRDVQYDTAEVLKESKITHEEKDKLLSFIMRKIKGLTLLEEYRFDNEVAYRLKGQYYLVNVDGLTNSLKINYLEDRKIDYLNLLKNTSSKVLSEKQFSEHIEFKKEIESKLGV